jgi:chromatin modification-related protein VID21
LHDIRSGHRFNENTLPPRPQVTRLPPKNQSTQTSQNPPRLLKSQQTTLESWVSPRSRNGSQVPEAELPASVRSSANVDEKTKDGPSVEEKDWSSGDALNGGAKEKPSDGRPSRQVGQDLALKAAADSIDIEDASRDSPARTPRIQKDSETLPTTPDALNPQNASSMEEKDLNGLLSPGVERLDSSSSQYRDKSDERRRDKSPLVLAPIATTADPQSSPASTNGPGSSNTPDPTPASPTTSPGDEGVVVEQRQFNSATKVEEVAIPNIDSNVSNIAGSPSQQLDNSDSFLVNSPELDQEPALKTDHRPLSATKESIPSTGSGPSRPDGDTSRKPTMRIDTRAGDSVDVKLRSSGSIMESPIPMTSSATPRRAPGSASAGHSPHRRETRIASGALERRSVSDILGETPKPSPYATKSAADSPVSAATRESFDLATSKARLADREKLEKERSKLSTVVFAKPQSGETEESAKTLRRISGEVLTKRGEQRDYLLTLFESKAYSPPRSAPLASLLQSAHKTVSTADHLIDYQEQMNCRTLKRIYQLQSADRWALRQHQRAVEPARPTSHWDFLLDHAKWMRTDFREERKWKLAAAKGVAEWCAEWVAGSAKEKRLLRVKVKPPNFLGPAPAPESEDVVMEDQPGPAVSSDSTPDLVASAEDDSASDGFVEDPVDIHTSNAPAAIFSLSPSDFSYPITKTPAAEKMFNELPLYEPARIARDPAKSDLAERFDARWKTDIVAVSRFATSKLRVPDWKIPSKRSRYEYAEDSPPRKDALPLPPEQTDVALFMPENKHIRDRIHPGHSFRPPSEHPMPSQAFFESRSSSQWLPSEDDELRKLVKEYSYNWSLISSCLSPRSLFVSGADRRTPWECFERWIGLEGLPADMLKTPYFKAYHSRIEAANRHVAAQQEAAQRQSDNPQLTLRRRTTTPVHIERRRNQKHLAMLDAMRKLAKKRETAIQKQQHANDLAAMRKVNEANQPRPPITTPAEFSRLKHDREQKLAERQEMYRQQILAHQKATMQQRTAQQLAQGNGVPNGVPRGPGTGPPGSSSAPPVAMPNGNPGANVAANAQRNMQGLPTGVIPNGQMPPGMMPYKGMTPAQVQANMAAGRGMPGHSPEQMMRIQAEAHRLQQQQMLAVQARQAQHSNSQNGQHSSPNMAHAAMANGNGSQNAAALAQFAAVNGMSSPSAPTNGNGSSPGMANGSSMGQALSSGHTPAISHLIAEVQARHPEMSPDEVNRQATARLSQYQKQQAMQAAAGHPNAMQQAQRNAMQQAALNAAAGGVTTGAHNANNVYQQQRGMMTNEQVQAYNMARQQQRQGGMPGQMGMAGLAPGAGGHGMVGGMTGSPVLPMARPVSSHTPHSRSATPREQRSGSIGMNGAQGSPRVSQQSMQT